MLADGENSLALEERVFRVQGVPDAAIVTALTRLIAHQKTRERVEKQLAIVSDDDFAWFCRNALPVSARNKLDDNKQSNNLWYEEALPPDTLLYTLVAERSTDAMQKFMRVLTRGDRKYVQLGGNETLGQGWFAFSVIEE